MFREPHTALSLIIFACGPGGWESSTALTPPSYCAAAGVGHEAESTLSILEGLLPGAELQMVNQVPLFENNRARTNGTARTTICKVATVTWIWEFRQRF